MRSDTKHIHEMIDLWRQGEFTPTLTKQPRGPCVHLGELTDNLGQCKSCNGRVRIKLNACAIYGLCSPTRQNDGGACCKSCQDWQSK